MPNSSAAIRPAGSRPQSWWKSALQARIGDNATALVVDVLALPDADRV